MAKKLKTPFKAPVVDRLSVRVLVDSAYERFMPKGGHEYCSIEHIGRISNRQMTTMAGMRNICSISVTHRKLFHVIFNCLTSIPVKSTG
jgi:hypothetical protein